MGRRPATSALRRATRSGTTGPDSRDRGAFEADLRGTFDDLAAVLYDVRADFEQIAHADGKTVEVPQAEQVEERVEVPYRGAH